MVSLADGLAYSQGLLFNSIITIDFTQNVAFGFTFRSEETGKSH